MAFTKTEKSGKGTFVTRLGEASVQWGAFVKETSPTVYPQLVLGQLVSLDAATGELIPTAASTDFPLGTVMVANSDRNEQKATVMLNAVATIRTSASSTIDYGQYVTTLGVNLPSGLPVNTAVGSGEWATGITLESANASEDEVIVAILASPVLLP